MKIPRITATKIMQLAHQRQDYCLLGIIDSDGHFHLSEDNENFLTLMGQFKPCCRVYNQHPDSLAFIESHPPLDKSYSIEIFQETDGVFGLRAWYQDNKMQLPVALEFEQL